MDVGPRGRRSRPPTRGPQKVRPGRLSADFGAGGDFRGCRRSMIADQGHVLATSHPVEWPNPVRTFTSARSCAFWPTSCVSHRRCCAHAHSSSRGAPHSGFASDIVRIRARTSGGTPGRPRRVRLFQRQKRRKLRRCHARTVSGFTMTRAARHPCQIRDNQTHTRRSDRVSGMRRGRARSMM